MNVLAASLVLIPRCPPPSLCAIEPDLVRLGDIADDLASTLQLSDADSDVSTKIVEVHLETIVPLLPKIYMPSVAESERKDAIEGLSRALDVLEETAIGRPYLTGRSLSAADAALLPSMILCEKTLPEHFGWTEWTDEALFWRRPRLHAWYEVILYERAARQAEQQIAARLEEVDFSVLAMDIPTAHLRTFPKHAL